MEDLERVAKKREINPKQDAGWFSQAFFIFPVQLLRKGAKKSLASDDIYEIVRDYKAGPLGDQMEAAWYAEERKEHPRLLAPIIRLFGLHYLLLTLTNLCINTPLILVKPILLGKIVSYFSPNSPVTKLTAIIYASCFLIAVMLRVIYKHSFVLNIHQLAFKIRIGCTSLIYRKSLRLSPKSFAECSNGKIVTMITKDLQYLDVAVEFSIDMLVGVIHIILMTYLMYKHIGISAIFGISLMFFFLPVQAFLGKLTNRFRLKSGEKTDMRVRVTQEILTAIKIIKMYTWEPFFLKVITLLRKREIRNLRVLFYVKAIALSMGALSSHLALYVCVIIYVYLGNHITAEKAFVVTGCFQSLRVVFRVYLPLGIYYIANMKASFRRVTEFLTMEEVDESQSHCHAETNENHIPVIRASNLCLKSDNGNNVISNVSLEMRSGLVALTGPVGAGKSTLLKLFLEDIRKSEGTLTIAGVMSYASQEPWLFPGTVRQNILFGEDYEEKRYEKVVQICALQTDLEQLPYGDATCLTDKGLNLSRGQKARINLARCIYKEVDIYLLDDCLAAVDAAVGKHIFDECVRKHLKGKMVVLVTHQIRFLEQVDRIVVMNKGRVDFDGDYTKLKEWNIDFKSTLGKTDGVEHNVEIMNEKNANEIGEDEESELLVEKVPKSDRGLYDEDQETGKVKKEVYMEYFGSGGGLKIFLPLFALFILSQVSQSWAEYFVSFWVDMEQKLSTFRQKNQTNTTDFLNLETEHSTVMKQYSFVILSATLLTITKACFHFLFCSNVSVNLHKKMFANIINGEMTFFDTHLSGNILNRFSRDLGLIDERLPHVIFEVANCSFILIAVLIIVSTVNSTFLIPSAMFAVILYMARQYYVPTSRSIRRLEGATRSPIIGHLNASLEGLTTIRASKAHGILMREFDKHQDLHNSVFYMQMSTARAFGFYLDSLCTFYITAIIMSFFIFKTNSLAGKVGLAITQSFSLTGLLQWGIRQWAEFENMMTSVERVMEYTKVPNEDKTGCLIDNWPKGGKIEYKKVILRYPPSNERVLKSLSFLVEGREKVGVVGRTGAGKSSIISTLFNLYQFEGSILIDNVDISTLSVDYLRSKLSIIPQDPVLFSGTLRDNLDPNSEFSDKQLWAALDEVEIKHLVATLDEDITDSGSNFSIGQKQLICLARAILRSNNILVLDEATANVDPQTDALIQQTIRRKFKHCTVITIAHRLHTIMDCDKILVLDGGNLIEYDSPTNLIAKKSGLFYNMVSGSGLL